MNRTFVGKILTPATQVGSADDNFAKPLTLATGSWRYSECLLNTNTSPTHPTWNHSLFHDPLHVKLPVVIQDLVNKWILTERIFLKASRMTWMILASLTLRRSQRGLRQPDCTIWTICSTDPPEVRLVTAQHASFWLL